MQAGRQGRAGAGPRAAGQGAAGQAQQRAGQGRAGQEGRAGGKAGEGRKRGRSRQDKKSRALPVSVSVFSPYVHRLLFIKLLRIPTISLGFKS